jgi:hypothetical protein
MIEKQFYCMIELLGSYSDEKPLALSEYDNTACHAPE